VSVLTIAADRTALIDASADRVSRLLQSAIDTRDAALVALTGGSTPAGVYKALADPGQRWRATIDWARVHLFWGDERNVPPSHQDSNFLMASRTLVSRVPVPASQIHRMRGELPADQAADAYEEELVDGFQAAGRSDCRFDVMLLGLGPDAHIASLFPGNAALDEAARRVVAPWVPHLGAYRITLTVSALTDADRIVMIVSGDQKAAAVKAAREAPPDRSRVPAQILRDVGDRVEWIIDRAAARALSAPRESG